MDEQGYVFFLQKNRKPVSVIQRYTASVRQFETYLAEHGKTIEEASPDDIRQGSGGFLALAMYYEYLGNERLCAAAHEAFSAKNYVTFKLSEIMGIQPGTIQKLKTIGIVTAEQMLAAGKAPVGRAALARETGIPVDVILELVKLSDQARIGGHKRVRARLYHDAGLDTLDKIAELEPEEVCRKLDEYIRQSGFNGIPPTPREAANSVRMARYLPRMVEY